MWASVPSMLATRHHVAAVAQTGAVGESCAVGGYGVFAAAASDAHRQRRFGTRMEVEEEGQLHRRWLVGRDGIDLDRAVDDPGPEGLECVDGRGLQMSTGIRVADRPVRQGDGERPVGLPRRRHGRRQQPRHPRSTRLNIDVRRWCVGRP